MKKNFLLFLICISCKKECNIKEFRKSMFIPNDIQILDCKTIDDFLTDGSCENYIVIKLNKEDIFFFINENDLVPYRKTEKWQYYFDPHFLSKALSENLEIPSINLENSYYNFWDIGKGSIECLIDIEQGYSIIRLEL